MSGKNNKLVAKWKKGATSFLSLVEKYFMPALGKIGENRYMQTIRNGVVSAIPMILVGSIFLVIYFMPIESHVVMVNGENVTVNSFGAWILYESGSPDWASFIMLPYRLTFAMMGFFVVLGMARSLAEHYKLDTQQACFIAILGYIISLVGPVYNGVGNATIISGTMGSASIFGGGIIAILSVELFRICVKYNITIKLPKQVPSVVSKPFAAVIPLLFVIVPCMLLFFSLKFDIHNFMLFLFSPIQEFFAGNNAGGMVVLILLITLLWVSGIHGVSIIGALARPFWISAAQSNLEIIEEKGLQNLFYSFSNGGNILTEPFYQWFVWIGGAGATLGLIVSMFIVSKSKYGKTMTSACAIPSIFNINELIMFGFPIVMNPTLIVPFILAPLSMGIVSYLAMLFGWVALPSLTPAWTLPAPVGAFFSTLDWKAIILCLVCIGISILVWLPFAKIYDKQLLKQERENEFNDKLNELKKEGKEINEEELMKQIEEKQKNYSYGFFSFKKRKMVKQLEKTEKIDNEQ